MEVYLVIFLTGLFGGTHCIGMCGGVVAMLSSALSKDIQNNPKQQFQYHLIYNLGRISSYILLGLIVGLIGSTLSVSPLLIVLPIVAGVMMLVMGLYIANWWLGLKKLEQLGQGFWQILQQRTKHLLPITHKKGAFVAGLFWGGMPCGLVYSALVLTLGSAQSIAMGGAMMLLFALGTLPSLLLVSGASIYVGRLINLGWVRKIVGVLMIVFGLNLLMMSLFSSHNHNNHPTTNTNNVTSKLIERAGLAQLES